MTKTLSIRLDSDIKERAESILQLYGLDISTFLRMTLYTTVNQGQIPYEIKYNPKFRSVSSLAKEEIEANSTISGNWLFDEEEGKFIRPEIVAEIEEDIENGGEYFAPNENETTAEFFERIKNYV
jgi:addiction module RelB/DinJ family antitoxin